MRPWVAIHVELLRDARFMRLDPAVRCAWYEALMEAAAEEGVLPALDDWAWRWRVAPEELASLLEWYLQEGWIAKSGDAYVVVQWEKYQRPLKKDATAAARMQRYRDRLRNAEPVTRNVTRNADRNSVTLRCPTGEERTGEREEKRYLPIPTVEGTTEPRASTPAKGRGIVKLASWVPGWYLTQGYEPNCDEAIIRNAMAGPNASRERLLAALQDERGIETLATMAVEGAAGRAVEPGDLAVVTATVAEICAAHQRRSKKRGRR